MRLPLRANGSLRKLVPPLQPRFRKLCLGEAVTLEKTAREEAGAEQRLCWLPADFLCEACYGTFMAASGEELQRSWNLWASRLQMKHDNFVGAADVQRQQDACWRRRELCELALADWQEFLRELCEPDTRALLSTSSLTGSLRSDASAALPHSLYHRGTRVADRRDFPGHFGFSSETESGYGTFVFASALPLVERPSTWSCLLYTSPSPRDS